MSHIAIISLGGTICMQPESSGALSQTRALDAKVLASAARLESFTLSLFDTCALASPSLDFAHAFAIKRAASEALAAGATGCVITQGTDTLEEMSYLLALLGADLPLVFTGAMRAANELGSDGAANLHASVHAANALDSGVWLCFNHRLFAPHEVRKRHTFALDAFASNGASAEFIEQSWRGLDKVAKLPPNPAAQAFAQLERIDAKVAIYSPALGDDGSILRAILASGEISGLVINGLGAGHVHARVMGEISRLAQRMPVLLCSRCGGGWVGRASYGYEGSELHLQSVGVMRAGSLDAAKARLLLACMISAGIGAEQMRAVLAGYDD